LSPPHTKTNFEKANNEELDLKLDINAAGIAPGKHKAYIEVDNQGNVQFIGLSNADEEMVKREIASEYTKQRNNRSISKSLGWLSEVLKMIDFCVPTQKGAPHAYVRNSKASGLRVNVYMKGKKESPLGEITGPYDKEFPEGSITLSSANIKSYVMLLKTNCFNVSFADKRIEFETKKDLVDAAGLPVPQRTVQSVLDQLEAAAEKKHNDIQGMLIKNAQDRADADGVTLSKEKSTPKPFPGWKLDPSITVPSKTGNKLHIDYGSLTPVGTSDIYVPRYPEAVNSIWFNRDITKELKDNVIGNSKKEKKGIAGKLAKLSIDSDSFAIRYTQGKSTRKAFVLGLTDQPLPKEIEREYQLNVKDVKHFVRMLGRYNGKGSIVLGGAGIIVETEKGDYKFRQTIPAIFNENYEAGMASTEEQLAR